MASVHTSKGLTVFFLQYLTINSRTTYTRPHTDKDSKDADCNCVCASGGRNREVVVRTGASESFYKTYTFDRVLGPESTQKVVFEDVVSPMLKEVVNLV